MLVRQGAIYHFRRRIPERLLPILRKREVWYSLRTSSRQEAKARAAALWVWTERIFGGVGKTAMVDATEIERLLEQAQEAIQRGDDAADIHARLDHLLTQKEAEIEAVALKAKLAESEFSALRFAADVTAREEEFGIALGNSISRAKALLHDTKGRLIESRQARKSLEGIVSSMASAFAAREPSAMPPKGSPMFGELQDAFLKNKAETTEDHRGYSLQTQKQTRVTLALWADLMGEKPVRDYTRTEAGEFMELLKQIPASHGKSRVPTPARQAIAAAAKKAATGQVVPRLMLKTVKRHFSALSQYWIWLKQRGHVDENIFSGFTFPGTKSSKKKRDIWTATDLERLLRAEWFRADRKSAFYWLPLVAMHSGMRLEEIANLRTNLDLEEEGGTWIFNIQDHPEDKWSPKSEAGARLVPLHSTLIELGFLDFVQERRHAVAPRLFGDLKPAGPDGKYGYTFSREFSKRKTALGLGKKTVFHSFRHTVRDLLESEDLQERWIDDVLGHERPHASEGAKTYKKALQVSRAKEVIEAIKLPVDIAAALRR